MLGACTGRVQARWEGVCSADWVCVYKYLCVCVCESAVCACLCVSAALCLLLSTWQLNELCSASLYGRQALRMCHKSCQHTHTHTHTRSYKQHSGCQTVCRSIGKICSFFHAKKKQRVISAINCNCGVCVTGSVCVPRCVSILISFSLSFCNWKACKNESSRGKKWELIDIKYTPHWQLSCPAWA